MSATSVLRYNTSVTTGDWDGASASTVTGANVFLGTSFLKVEELSAFFDVTADTASLTMAPNWQVSNDGTTWVAPLNDDGVVQAYAPIVTATSGQFAMPAPKAVYGYRFARARLTLGGATGAAADLWSIGYSYRQNYGPSGG